MPNGDDHVELAVLKNDVAHIRDAVDRIETAQRAQWGKIDAHGRQIATWRGMLMVLTGLVGIAWAEVKGLFGGGR